MCFGDRETPRELIILTVGAHDNHCNRALGITTCMATLITMYPLPDNINMKAAHR